MTKHYPNTSWQKSELSKKYTDKNKWSYTDHYHELIQKYEGSTNVNVRIAYGQLLSDLHPFATASTFFPTRSNIAGGGEGAAIKDLIELLDKINSIVDSIPVKKVHEYSTTICSLIEKLIDFGGCEHFLSDDILFKKFIRDSAYNNIKIYLVEKRKEDLLPSLKTLFSKI